MVLNKTSMKILITLLVIFSLTINLSAQINIQGLSDYLNALNDNKEFNGSVLIGDKGKVAYKNSFGYADFGNQIQNADSSLTNIASISKTFTTIAILQLTEKRKLKLDDPYSKYFKDFPY